MLLPLLAGSALANDPQPAESWRDVYPNESYWGYEVSIGYYGARVFTDTGWTGRTTRLYATAQLDSGASINPIWQDVDGDWSLERAVASADDADVHAVLCQEQPVGSTSRSAHLEVFSSSTTQPILSWYFPDTVGGNGVNFCDVSSDGRWVTAAIKVGSDAHVVVFDLASSTPSTPVLDTYPGLFGEIEFLAISDDGTRVNLTSKLQGRVLGTAGGPDLHSEYYFDTLEVGHSFSDSGNAFARPTGAGVKVSKLVAGSYVLAGEFNPYAWDAPQQSYLTALNADGSVVAAAFFTAPDFQTVEVFAWDVHSGSELLHDTLSGSGSLDNWPSDLVISDSGDRLALGLWGDEAQLVPEITVYQRGGSQPGYQRLTQFDTLGSVGDLDMSGDGEHLASTGRSTHFNQIGGDKFVASYDLGADLRLGGLPIAGSSVTVEFYPQSTGSVALLVSTVAGAPTPFGAIGTLYLERSQLTFQPMGAVDTNGMASKQLSIPTALAGSSLYLQGYSSSPRRLSKTWLPLVVQ